MPVELQVMGKFTDRRIGKHRPKLLLVNLQAKLIQLIGHTDMPMDDLGLAQARQVGLHMRAVRLDAVITSPLARARITASEIARHQALPGGVLISGLRSPRSSHFRKAISELPNPYWWNLPPPCFR